MAFDGARHPVCPERVFRAAGGGLRDRAYERCPRRSRLGRTSPLAFDEAGPFAQPAIDYVNGGRNRIWALTTLFSPALHREAIPVRVRRRPAGWTLALEVPPIFLILAGVDLRYESWPLAIGGTRMAPRYLTVSRRCPKRGYLGFRARIDHLDTANVPGSRHLRGRAACRAG